MKSNELAAYVRMRPFDGSPESNIQVYVRGLDRVCRVPFNVPAIICACDVQIATKDLLTRVEIIRIYFFHKWTIATRKFPFSHTHTQKGKLKLKAKQSCSVEHTTNILVTSSRRVAILSLFSHCPDLRVIRYNDFPTPTARKRASASIV